MHKGTGGFLRRLSLLIVLGLLASGCGITPETVNITPVAFTPISAPTQNTAKAQSRPFWELTTTPDPSRATAISAMAQTAQATEVLPTPAPGQELTAYLPRLADLPQCRNLDYVVTLTSARASCSLEPRGSLSITLTASPAPYAPKSLTLPAAYKPVQFDTIGDASIAGVNATGDAMMVAFIKLQLRVTLTYSTPNQAVDSVTVRSVARLLEAKTPESSQPPLALSFTENQNLENKGLYFSAIHFSLINNGQYRFTSNYQEGDRVCVYAAPRQRDYGLLWTIVLYDLQTEQVVKKMLRGMYAQNLCGGLEPDYPKDTYKPGDRYEVRIAVNDEWIATYPLVTSNPSRSAP